MTTHACVYIGGFAGSEKARDRIAEALIALDEYSTVNAYTLSYVTNHPDEVQKAVRESQAIFTHSAGVISALSMANKGQTIHAIAPPIPRSVPELSILRLIPKTLRLQQPAYATEVAKEVASHNTEAVFELIMHPWANLRHAIRIARFNVLDPDIRRRLTGIAFMSHDEFFGLSPNQVGKIMDHSLKNVVVLNGEHAELQLDPKAVLSEYFTKLGQQKNRKRIPK